MACEDCRVGPGMWHKKDCKYRLKSSAFNEVMASYINHDDHDGMFSLLKKVDIEPAE